MTTLQMWTVYDHPRDFPNSYVARCFDVDGSGPRATDNIMVSPSLDALRDMLAARGLTALCRSPEDDPKIVETWL
jgi:hypothetical protein